MLATWSGWLGRWTATHNESNTHSALIALAVRMMSPLKHVLRRVGRACACAVYQFESVTGGQKNHLTEDDFLDLIAVTTSPTAGMSQEQVRQRSALHRLKSV